MIKPAKCQCGIIPEPAESFDGTNRILFGCKIHGAVYARTIFGAILRWNWRQWRARRKSKGEATT